MEISTEDLFNLQILAERAVKEKIEKMKGNYYNYFDLVYKFVVLFLLCMLIDLYSGVWKGS